jgi:acyl-[acyl-carrier-protein] desaturase
VEDRVLLSELEPLVATLIDRHLESAKEWFPHEYVPWSRGRDYVPGEEWDPAEYEVNDGVRSSLFVNLLTEDNLPYYFHTISNMFGQGGPWAEWSHRWTAEEGRHSIVIRDYFSVTRALDPVALERARMAQVTCGEVPEPDSVMESMLYVAMQELATRVAHRRTGKLMVDPVGETIMKRVAMDENLHHLFYRDIASSAQELDPDQFMIALERQVRDFEMPGTGIVGFKKHAAAIAREGIYDFAVHYDTVIAPVVLKHFDVEHMEGLSPAAESARDDLMSFVERLERFSRRSKERQERRAAQLTTAG